MLVDFFKAGCQTQTNEELFGLCDDSNATKKEKAYLDFIDKEKWIATVINNKNKEITFTAIDYCVLIWDRNIDNPSRCDGMMNYEDTIIFIELKTRGRNTLTTDQLEKTILPFLENVDIDNYNVKKAYVSNKPMFAVNYTDKKDRFIKEYSGFRCYANSKIIIE